MAEIQIQKLGEKHRAIIDWLIANPQQSMAVLANEMDVSRSWLSIVMNSDVFREEYTKRRQEHNRELSRQLVERQLKVALKALDRLDVILDDDEVEDRLVLDTADRVAKNLGFSPSKGNAPQLLHEETTIERETAREVAPGVVERARERMRRVTTTSHGESAHALPAPDG